MPSFRRALALLAAASVTGCILLVSPTTGGSVCNFAGAKTMCGSCIAGACQGEIDACCGDATCTSAVMPLVDSCATKQDTTCATLATAGGSSAPVATALGKCVARECVGECTPVKGTSKTNCASSSLGDGTLCSCQGLGSTNTFVCSAAVFPGTKCCAPVDWPQDGQECDCFPAGCQPFNGGCNCNLVDYSEPDLATTCNGLHCCKAMVIDEASDCACSEAPCTAGMTEVPTCGVAQLECPAGEMEVASCSVIQ